MNGLGVVFLAGLAFAVGLGVSGMTDANKVLGFLDLSSGWDPTLAFVMAGAIGVHLPLRRWIERRGRPAFAETYERPPAREITARLAGGAALFGAGWGLGGYCPGPGLVAAATGAAAAAVFVVAMTAGMWLADRVAPAES